MSLEEFSKGHGGAGGAPVNGETSAEEKPQESGSGFVPSASSESILQKYGISKQQQPETTTEEPATSEFKLTLGVRLPEDFASRGAMERHIAKGGKVYGVNSDEKGNLRDRPAEPGPSSLKTLLNNAKDRPKAATESLEDKLRARMPIPGSRSALKNQRQIINSTNSNAKILEDHWLATKEAVQNTGIPELAEAHQNIGLHIGLAKESLKLAHEQMASGRIHHANIHLRMATNALHTANQSLNDNAYSLLLGSKSPVGLAATDEDRAHALVEHAIPSETSKLAKTIRLDNTQVANNTFLAKRMHEINTSLKSSNPFERNKYLGLHPDLLKFVTDTTQKGTPKGGPEWDTLAKNSPNAYRDDIDLGLNEGSDRKGAVRSATPGGSPGTMVPTERRKIYMVATHPDPHPEGTRMQVDDNKLSGTYGLPRPVYQGTALPLKNFGDIKFVPFGQHHGLKVINRFGIHIPHSEITMGGDGRAGERSLNPKELQDRGALMQVYNDETPVPSHPGAQAPRPQPTPPPRRMKKTKRQQEGEDRAVAAAVKERNSLIEDTQAAIESDKETAFRVLQTGKFEGMVSQQENAANKSRGKKGKGGLSAGARRYMEANGIKESVPQEEKPEEAGEK